MTLPLRISVVAGVFVFLVAVGTTNLALLFEHREADRTTERLGQVYLDGLAAALSSGPIRDSSALAQASLASFFEEQQGIRERAIFIYSAAGALVAAAGETGLEARAREYRDIPSLHVDSASGLFWASRATRNADLARLVVALDVAEMLSARTRRLFLVYTIDFIVAGLCGVIVFVILRRLSAPIEHLLRALSTGSDGSPAHIPAEVVARTNKATQTIFSAYNKMVDQVIERESLAVTAYEREQAAALGRLAATIAHEVRNPLGGLAAAVSTLRQFGADAQVRADSLGLLERGIEMISRVVTSTLNLYRPDDERRLRSVDFQDLVVLVGPEARRRNVRIDLKLDIPSEISLQAGGIRQILLNLLLNACAATPPGGVVSLAAKIQDQSLVLEVRDQGKGLEPEGIQEITARSTADGESRHEPAASKRIGISVIVNLLEHLKGCASIEHLPGEGTLVLVTIPMVGPA